MDESPDYWMQGVLAALEAGYPEAAGTMVNATANLSMEASSADIPADDNVMVVGNQSIVVDEHGVPICEGPTHQEMQFYVTFAWWLEGLGQIGVGLLGFLANSIAIPILLSPEMVNIFNRLLTCLAVADNVFIVCSILEAVRKHLGSTETHDYLFGTFLYQFHNMVLCVSTYITVVLALERYRAVWRPIEYRNSVLTALHPWRRIMMYVAPVVAFSVLFNCPKFFETKFEEVVVAVAVPDEGDLRLQGNVTTATRNRTVLRLTASELRLDDTYVLWYSNVARLIVTGAVPFVSLAYFNFKIYTVLKRRRRMSNRPNNGNNPHLASAANQHKAEETRQAIVLFVIVILFVLCHALRIILNVKELFSLARVRASLKNGCHGLPLWSYVGASVSHFLITVNASINFFIYCFMCELFRKVLREKAGKVLRYCHLSDRCIRTAGDGPEVVDPEVVECRRLRNRRQEGPAGQRPSCATTTALIPRGGGDEQASPTPSHASRLLQGPGQSPAPGGSLANGEEGRRHLSRLSTTADPTTTIEEVTMNGRNMQDTEDPPDEAEEMVRLNGGPQSPEGSLDRPAAIYYETDL